MTLFGTGRIGLASCSSCTSCIAMALLIAPVGAVHAQDNQAQDQTAEEQAQPTQSADDSAKLAQEKLTQQLLAEEDEEGQEEPNFDKLLGASLEAPELTPEQEARIPAARVLVEAIYPVGSFSAMFNQVYDDILKAMMVDELGGSMSSTELAASLGADEEGLEQLDMDQRKRLTELVDPAYPDRTRLVVESR